MNKIFVFYKPKDIKNIEDIIDIASKNDVGKIIFIPRENSDIDWDALKKEYSFVEILDYNTFVRLYGNYKIAVIETYSAKLINEVNIKNYDIFIFGSEDYGIPMEEIKKLDNYDIIKIPTKYGSYNLTSSFVIVLAELRFQ